MANRSSSSILCVLILLSLIASGCGGNGATQGVPAGGQGGRRGGPRGGASGGDLPVVQIKTLPVERVHFQRRVDLSGTLISIDQARVSSEVTGIVKEVLVELGTEVRAGQPLVQIDARELELARQRAESALRQTEAQLGISPDTGAVPADEEIAAVRTAMANRDEARAQYTRALELMARGLLPKADLETTETRVKVTEAAFQASLENVRALKAGLLDRRAAYELAVKKVKDAVVRAPISGSVSDRPVQRGEFIRENTVVATIVQTNPLKLVSAVQERYSNDIHANQRVLFSVESLPDRQIEGRVAFISPAVDQATRTFSVEVHVDNPTRILKPGFFAKGVILTKQDENVLAVEDRAVIMAAGVSSVYIVADGVVKQQTVRLGAREGTRLEVLDGLKGDEILAASNLNELVSGIQVRAVAEAGDDWKGGSEGEANQVDPNLIAPARGGRRGGPGGS